MQHIGNMMDSSAYKILLEESFKQFDFNENLRMYFNWCLSYRRMWSDAFANWCDAQPNLTLASITTKWKQCGKLYRNRDIWDRIDRANRLAAERRAAAQNPEQHQQQSSLPQKQAPDGMSW